MKSYVTTKQGDSGKTRLLNGQWVSKDSGIIECLGKLDSLRVHLSLLRLKILETNNTHKDFLSNTLLWLVHCCFITGTQISDPSEKQAPPDHPQLNLKHLQQLEGYQSKLEEHLHLPKKFVASASNIVSAHADIATTVARDFERQLVSLLKNHTEISNETFLPFYNRLSDFLFIVARILDDNQFNTVDYSIFK